MIAIGSPPARLMTNIEKSQLSGVKETLLYTLYYRALDQRSKAPIVGDTWAADVLDRITADNRKGLLTAKLGASGRFPPLLRARRLDDWAREFLARHPDASVLHLGCGLDSRAFRLDVPERVRWYDLDFPDVIALRRRLYPERAGYRLLASSATDPGWLDEIPVDRPTLIVAEGVLPYLTEADGHAVRTAHRLASCSGELIFDGVAGPTARMSKLFQWSLGDPREIERWNPRLALIDVVPVVADFEQIPYRKTPRPLPTDEQDASHAQCNAAAPLPILNAKSTPRSTSRLPATVHPANHEDEGLTNHEDQGLKSCPVRDPLLTVGRRACVSARPTCGM